MKTTRKNSSGRRPIENEVISDRSASEMSLDISFFVWDFPGNGQRLSDGVHKAVFGLATGLADKGAKVSILCEAKTRQVQIVRGVWIRSFQAEKRDSRLKISKQLRAFLTQGLSSDIVVLNGVFNPKNILVSRVLHRIGYPYIVVPHTAFSDALFHTKPTQKFVFWHLFEKQMLRNALCIQLLGRGQDEPLRRRGVNTLTFSSPNGISDQYCGNHRESEWSSDGPVRLIFFGRIDSYTKGLDLLLEAFSKVRESSDVHLTLKGPDTGDGQGLNKLIMNLGIEQHVTFEDPVYDVNPVGILSAYDLFVLPSRREGFPTAAIEAMLASRPVLITDVSGLAEYVVKSGCGVVVKPEIDSIAGGILDLIRRRKDWPRMGSSARSLATKIFKWPQIAEKVLSEYGKALSTLRPHE